MLSSTYVTFTRKKKKDTKEDFNISKNQLYVEYALCRIKLTVFKYTLKIQCNCKQK